MPISILIFLLIIILILIICSIIINSLPFNNNNILGGTKGFKSNNEFTRMLDFLKEDAELYNKTPQAWIVEYTDDKPPLNIQKRINNFTLKWLDGYYLRSQVPNLYKDLNIGTIKGEKRVGNKKELKQINGLYNNIIDFIKLSKIGNTSEANNIKSSMDTIFSKYGQTNNKDNETVDEEILGYYNAEVLESYNKAKAENELMAAERKNQLAYQLQAKKDYDNRTKGIFGVNWEDSLDIDDPKDKSDREKLKLALNRAKATDNYIGDKFETYESDTDNYSIDFETNSIKSNNSSIKSTESLKEYQNKLLIADSIKKEYAKVQAEKQKSENELMAAEREKSEQMLSDYQNGIKLVPDFNEWVQDEKNKKVKQLADEWEQRRIDAEKETALLNAREEYNNRKILSDATKKEQRVKSINDIKTEIVSKKYNINLNKKYNKEAIDRYSFDVK
jgi:hypothetical protein